MQENLREEVAMDVDDGDERADNSPETTAEFYVRIAKLNREIERMALNSKAVEKRFEADLRRAAGEPGKGNLVKHSLITGIPVKSAEDDVNR
ncbi:hypothetical protein F4604DRAFT_1938909 [Suillus subluteus]|nr:hypothetical protein F4604DRAFT_1938909 [Suillus subluteus]